MNSQWGRQIADAFSHHWHLAERLGEIITLNEEVLAASLLKQGYPISVEEEALKRRREVRIRSEHGEMVRAEAMEAAYLERQLTQDTVQQTLNSQTPSHLRISDYVWNAVNGNAKTE